MLPYYSEEWHEIFHGLMLSGNGSRGFVPNSTQEPIIEDFIDGVRIILICGGERSGKSMTAAATGGIDIGPRTTLGMKEQQRRYWIIGPDYRQARPEFQYIFDALYAGGLIEDYSMPQAETQPWSLLTKWNTIIETRSSSDVMKIASFTVNGVMIVEAAQQQEEVLRKARGRVAETRGWIILVGTLEESLPWYEDLLRKWAGPNLENARSHSLPMWSNIDIFPGGKADPEIRMLIDALPADYVARRYGAQAVRHHNLVIPEFDYKTHMRDIQYTPNVPVELAIDPGKNAYAVLFCQHLGAYTHVLDSVYTRGEIVQSVIPRVMKNPLWQYINLEPNTSIIDVAGKQEQGNKSQVEIWRETSGLILGSKYWKIRDSIDIVRFRLRTDPILGEPLILFSNKMRTGVASDGTATEVVSEFDLWRWGKNAPNRDEREEPIDNNNHAIKALAYKLLDKYGLDRDMRALKATVVAQKSWIPGMARVT